MGTNDTTSMAFPHTTVRLAITEIELCGWLGAASPGDVLEYHRGFLVVDREPHACRLPPKDREELVRMAWRAHWAADRGFAHLVQRRHGPNDFSYLIITRPRTKTAAVSFLAVLASEAA